MPPPARRCGRRTPSSTARRPYTITGAPRVFKGKVIIGNGGAEYGVRGYITAYDADDRRAEVALVHGAGRPDQAVRERRDGQGRQDLGSVGQVLGGRRRRHGVGHARLRPRTQPDVRRHRQRLAVGASQAQPEGRRQPVPGVDRRAQPRHRQVRLALPGNARRQLGLHVDPADDPRRPEDRRQAAQGDPACAEERLLLRHRPHQRPVHLGEELRRHQLGHRLRQEGPADRDADRTRGRPPARDHPEPVRRAQLAFDVVQPADGPRLHAGAERAVQA